MLCLCDNWWVYSLLSSGNIIATWEFHQLWHKQRNSGGSRSHPASECEDEILSHLVDIQYACDIWMPPRFHWFAQSKYRSAARDPSGTSSMKRLRMYWNREQRCHHIHYHRHDTTASGLILIWNYDLTVMTSLPSLGLGYFLRARYSLDVLRGLSLRLIYGSCHIRHIWA